MKAWFWHSVSGWQVITTGGTEETIKQINKQIKEKGCKHKHTSLKRLSMSLFVCLPPRCRYIFGFPKQNIPKLATQNGQNAD